MAISMRTGNSTKTRSINAIIRPNFQRCPRRGHTCNSFLEDNADGMTLQDRRLEAQGLRRCSKRATPAADPRVEALYLCTPHHLHREHVAMAAQARKHILVEKPIARTLAEAQAMIAQAQEAGVTLMVAENYRFMAAVRQCKALIERGAVGDLRLVQLHEEAPFRP